MERVTEVTKDDYLSWIQKTASKSSISEEAAARLLVRHLGYDIDIVEAMGVMHIVHDIHSYTQGMYRKDESKDPPPVEKQEGKTNKEVVLEVAAEGNHPMDDFINALSSQPQNSGRDMSRAAKSIISRLVRDGVLAAHSDGTFSME